ncbi:hypothetical protein CJF25_06515 [Photobacterium phosphoreum]|uniref:NACHT domain-containing protein n=1 Tax=Photobacterium phosphoreum TaxID=659 RepID=UPI001E36FBFD|nr:NACHT domain-containing protein [Photobacterium phosphoreum]MCD9462647.1 hypothetical protein [Photobacterium phosphoreum]
MSTQKNKPLTYVTTVLNSFKEKAAGSNLAEIRDWFSDTTNIEKYHNCIKKEQEVFTFNSTDKAKKINSFFYPTKVVDIEDNCIALSNIIKLNGKNGILINGRLGQGKSILLKYLQFLELNEGNTIPLFLEIRKIRNSANILDSARDKLNQFGLSCSTKLFEFLLNEGRISLFLDGFDELTFELRDSFNEELSNIVIKYPSAKILVTSRYNTEVSLNQNFKNYTISLLDRSELAPFIRKIMGKDEYSDPIISKIQESNEFDYSVLDTPMMVTWFIIIYNKKFKIPKTKLGFYEDLFGAILSRHDGLKDSFNRSSKSKLNDDELKEVFSTLCFLTRKAQQKMFTSTTIKDYIQQALNYCDYTSVKNTDYLYDLTHITCLLRKDGHQDYEFIHQTVAQYFSALFIKSSEDINAIQFYESRQTDYRKLEDELYFLDVMDNYRYVKYFFHPLLSQYLNIKDERLSVELINKILKTSMLAINEPEGQSPNFVTSLIPDCSDYIVVKLFGDIGKTEIIVEKINEYFKHLAIKDFSIVSKLYEMAQRQDRLRTRTYSYVPCLEFFQSINELDNLLTHLSIVLFIFTKPQLEKAEKVINRPVKKQGMFA